MREGYGTRAPRAEEAAQVAALVHEAERSQDPTAGARTPAEFRAVWSRLDLARDARVATAPDGTLAGYAQVDVVRPGRLHADGYTRSGHLGTGIGAALIDWSGDRARRLAATAPHAGAPATLLHYVMLDGAADRMLRARDYRLVRVHQRMRRSLAGPLPAPRWPEGVTVRPATAPPRSRGASTPARRRRSPTGTRGWAAPSSGGAPTWSTSGPTPPCGSSPSAPGGSSASPSAT